MKNIIIYKYMLWLLLLLDLFLLVHSHMEDEDAMKVLCCINIITSKNLKTEGPEPNYYSPKVLACFFNIKKEQVQKILYSLENEEEEEPLSLEELKEITDIDSLKYYSEEEIKKKSEELNRIVKEFQKIDEETELREKENYKGNNDNENDDDNDIDDIDDDDDDDDDEFEQDPDSKLSVKGILKLIKKGINELFKVISNIWFYLFIMAILYIILLIIRKFFSIEKKIKIKKDEKISEKKIENKEDKEKEKEKGKEENKEKNKEKID